MKNTLFILLFLLHGASAQAELFTVLAQSGLNVRKEPSATSEKTGYLPFGTVVEAEMNYGYDIDPGNSAYTHFSEVIEGKRGFWVKISYEKISGYIFSGFGLAGEWVVPASQINREYRLLLTGQYCDPINYDPALHWYALTRKNGHMYMKKTGVILKITHEFTEKDTLGEANMYWREHPLVVSSTLPDTVLLLVGSKQSLPEKEIWSAFLNADQQLTFEGKFLYPEETLSAFYAGKSYTFRAFETVNFTSEKGRDYQKTYQLEFQVNNLYPTLPDTYNISAELGLGVSGQKHAQYKTPQLLWTGDLNSDGLPDFIYCARNMADGCGVSSEYQLFLSDKNNPDKLVRKVAAQLVGNCIT